jgi:hypothetical protein
MKFTDLFRDHKAETATALATANKTILELSARLEALEAKGEDVPAASPDDSTDVPTDTVDTTDETPEKPSLIDALIELVKEYTADSDEATEDTTSDTTEDASDDANEETAKKATKSDKIRTLATSVSKIIAENKSLKADAPKQLIRAIAEVGIPTAIATKPADSKTTAGLTGRARTAAAFTAQLNNK